MSGIESAFAVRTALDDCRKAVKRSFDDGDVQTAIYKLTDAVEHMLDDFESALIRTTKLIVANKSTSDALLADLRDIRQKLLAQSKRARKAKKKRRRATPRRRRPAPASP